MSDFESLVAALKSLTQGEEPNAHTLPMAEDEWYTRPDTVSYGIVSMDFEADAMDADNEKQTRALEGSVEMIPSSTANIAPRLRMTTLYSIAGSENRLVCGTGNRSERYMGYFTKWGDGASDFNPISDLTVTEVYEFLDWLNAPESIRKKAPSAGLFEGQTDEQEMGVSYAAVDAHLRGETVSPAELAIIQRYHARAGHKLVPIPTYESWKAQQEQ